MITWRKCGLFGLLTMGLALVFVFRSKWEASSSAVPIFTNTFLRFVGTSYGTNAFFYGNVFQKAFCRWLPKQGIKLGSLGLNPLIEYQVSHSVTDIPTLWFSIKTDSNKVWNAGVMALDRLRVLETSGKAESLTYHNTFREMYRSRDPEETILSVPLYAYSRDQADLNLKLQIWDGRVGEWESLTDFRLVNPQISSRSSWGVEPQTLPQTAFAEDVAVTLLQVQAVDNSGQRNSYRFWNQETRIHMPAPHGMTELQVEISMNGQLTMNWVLGQCVIADPLGNSVIVHGERPSNDGRYRLIGKGLLPNSEPKHVAVELAQHLDVIPYDQHLIFSNLTQSAGSAALVEEVLATNSIGAEAVAKWTPQALEIRLVGQRETFGIASAYANTLDNSSTFRAAQVDRQNAVFVSLPMTNAHVHVAVRKRLVRHFYVKP